MDWWRPFSRRRDLDRQLDAELHFHIEKLAQEKVALGMEPASARREALLEFGGPAQIREELLDVHRAAMIETSMRNLRFAFRFIRKSPSFSATIIVTLAIGIGANSAVFSAIDAILLRPLPFPEGDQLMQLVQYDLKATGSEPHVAPARLEDWNRMNFTFQAITGYYTQDVSETSGALPEKITQALVGPRFFQVWGVSPTLGRGFVREEEHASGAPATVISDRLWRRRFGANPGAIGQVLRVGAQSFSIVGVMPESFRFPERDVDFWTPVPVDSVITGKALMELRNAVWYTVVGRLKPGATVAQARTDLIAVQSRLGREYPRTDAKLGVRIEPLRQVAVGDIQRSLWLLFGSVTVLLLIACTNIAALLFARTAERQHEISIRYSLGASRSSIVMQLLTEVFVLAAAGSTIALLVAAGASRVFGALARNLPRLEEVRLDGRLILYTAGCALITTLLCGLLPAIRGTDRSISVALAKGARTQVAGRHILQWLLVSVQVALSVTLLVGSGLLLRSFQSLGQVLLGFDPHHVVTLRISANWSETVDLPRLRHRVDREIDALRNIPGVESAASALALPGVSSGKPNEVRIVEGPADPDHKTMAATRFVSTGYFSAMRIPLLAGEACRESLANTAVVNRSFVDTYLAGRAVIGTHLRFVSSNDFLGVPLEIRGVAADAREEGLQQAPVPIVYWCNSAPVPSPALVIRTRGEPLAMTEAIRRKIHEIEPNRSVYQVMTLEDRLSDSLAENRLRTTLLTFFALCAISLACIGLYGTQSYVVRLRRREVGLRLAMGAQRGQIVSHFMSQGLHSTVVGCLAGLVLAALFTSVLKGMLYGVTGSDGPTFAGVATVVLVTTSLASSIPAARAARVEPMQVLRED